MIFLVLLCLYRVLHVVVREILVLALSGIISVKRRELHVSVMPAAGDDSSVRHGIGHDVDVLPLPFSRAYDINEFQIRVEEGSALPESFDEDPGIVPHLSHCLRFFPLSVCQGVRGIGDIFKVRIHELAEPVSLVAEVRLLDPLRGLLLLLPPCPSRYVVNVVL